MEQIVTPVAGIQVGGYIENRGKDLFALAKEKGLEGIIANLQSKIREDSRENQWVQPKLVSEVAYAEWTDDEQLRQTTFLGWRDDKDPKEVAL